MAQLAEGGATEIYDSGARLFLDPSPIFEKEFIFDIYSF